MKYLEIILHDIFGALVLLVILSIGLELAKPGLATNYLNIPVLISVALLFGLAVILNQRYR